MPAAELPVNEQARLQNLYSYGLLDTLPEKDYDDITKLASHICETPVSLVTLVDKDRQWFKSAYGTHLHQTRREDAFCSHAILEPNEILIVPNAEEDHRFADNPLVHGDANVMFYAGVPLLSEEGFAIGSLCVIDNKPRQLTESQQQALKILANQTIRLIVLHKKTRELTHSRQLLQEINRELESFAQNAAENLKRPCNDAIEITDLVTEKYDSTLDADGKQLLSLIRYSCQNIKNTIELTIERTRRINLLQDTKSLFSFTRLMQELKLLLPPLPGNVVLGNHEADDALFFYKDLLLQILAGIVSSCCWFNNKEELQVKISYVNNQTKYVFTVADNGKGIPVITRQGEFILLQTSATDDRDKTYTDNLTAVKKLISMLCGTLEMSFEENNGTVFSVTFPK